MREPCMSGDDEADAEGAAFDSGHFYAIGSHGTSRRKKEFQASRYSVYRIEPNGTVQASHGRRTLFEKHCGDRGSLIRPTQQSGRAFAPTRRSQ